MSSLQTMPDDGSIKILKQFQTDLCNDAINRLYSIVPDLDDRPLRRSDSPNGDQVDLGVEIVRAWFRIMVLNDSEAEVLEHASRSRCIDEFLAGCQAVQYLRVAICAQTLAGGDIKSIRLLGGVIPSSTEGLRMTKPAWDILYVLSLCRIVSNLIKLQLSLVPYPSDTLDRRKYLLELRGLHYHMQALDAWHV